MKYLLDTHAWIWALEAPEKLPDSVRAMLLEPDHLPFGLAAISPWEVAKKESKGLLHLSMACAPVGRARHPSPVYRAAAPFRWI